VTNFVIADLDLAVSRAKRDYETLRLSIDALDASLTRTVEHARTATNVLGTEGFLAYFEEVKSSGDPDAVDLLNELVDEFNSAKSPPDSIASVSLSFLGFPFFTNLFCFTLDARRHSCACRRVRSL
jgi:hypothetical protein